MDEMTLLLALDRADEAEGSVKLAIEKEPNNALLYSVLGGLYDKKAAEAKDDAEIQKWYGLAEEAYKQAIAKDANYFDAYFNIGVLYNNRAANEYEKCNKLKSDTEYVKCKKVADDIYLQAVPYFEGAHRLDPKDQQTIQQLMKLYAKTNDQAKYQEMKDKLGK
jgi:tetratricopeptide (TPR) repeat protein